MNFIINTKNKSYLFLIFLLIFFLISELLLRFFILPSEDSYGYLFGKELPPYKLTFTYPKQNKDSSNLYNKVITIVNGKKITRGDLWGIYQKDSILGYKPQENRISKNGWWKTNNLGARFNSDVGYEIPDKKKRIIVFGDSYAMGSRIPYEFIWTNMMNSMNPQLEVLNFGVDGYSMAQAFLRYKSIKEKIDYNLSIMMFVPSIDPLRDINIIRYFYKESWGNYHSFNPRFIIENNKLKLIDNICNQIPNIESEMCNFSNKKVKNYIAQYDRFYFQYNYETPFLIGK